MTYNVLVVDDSNFFQNRLKEIINEHPKLNVIGVATNGQEAIDLARELLPDVITMDYEMPLLDGVTAVKMIMAERKVPIIMFSPLTYDGARITLDALDAGAADFISKNFSEISQNSSSLKRKLHSKLLSLAEQFNTSSSHVIKDDLSLASAEVITNELTDAAKAEVTGAPQQSSHVNSSERQSQSSSAVARPAMSKVLIIGASTGGPVAVHQILDLLPANFPLPTVVIQHMPPNFTQALAERLNRVCALSVTEAKHGNLLMPGHVLVAPGGMQCMFDAKGHVKLIEGDERMSYRPSLDIAFASAANVFGDKVLGIVLTGMGSDGCEGAKILKQKGGVLWSQTEASCVVYGMPKAVVESGLSDYVLSPESIGAALTRVY